MNKLPIETPNPYFGLYLYPFAKDIMEEQQDVGWTSPEIPVENDIHDFRTVMSPEQLNLNTVTLQTFVEIEQKVGDIWGTVATWFPHSEIEGACKEMERMEKSVHAFFYQKMSDVLNIDPEETAKNQQTIKVLKDKLELIKHITSNLEENKPLSLATVTMLEQVLLFSNFAMLKSFKANGNNLMKYTLTGVDFVIQDEQIHGELAKGLFLNYIKENEKHKIYDLSDLREQIYAVMEEIVSHEDAIIDYTFPGNIAINDITGKQLKTFIRVRANTVLNSLGYESLYYADVDVIGGWFYQGTKGIKSHDFFASGTSQYRRSWKFENFSRKPFIKGVSDE